MPDGEERVRRPGHRGSGRYESPWPRIYDADAPALEAGWYGTDDMFLIYKLRARWRLLNPDHPELRRQLADLLVHNDRDNNLLNSRISDWNQTLAGSGFPEFADGDLRGVDLSGLHIVGQGDGPVLLRHVDLRYAELHYLGLPRANLYGAQLTGIKAVSARFDGANLGGCLARGADFIGASFAGADLGSADFTAGKLRAGAIRRCQLPRGRLLGGGASALQFRRATGPLRPRSSRRPFRRAMGS